MAGRRRKRRTTRTVQDRVSTRNYHRKNASDDGLSGADIALIIGGVALLGYLGLVISGAVTPQLI
jgi:hypothetical protein